MVLLESAKIHMSDYFLSHLIQFSSCIIVISYPAFDNSINLLAQSVFDMELISSAPLRRKYLSRSSYNFYPCLVSLCSIWSDFLAIGLDETSTVAWQISLLKVTPRQSLRNCQRDLSVDVDQAWSNVPQYCFMSQHIDESSHLFLTCIQAAGNFCPDWFDYKNVQILRVPNYIRCLNPIKGDDFNSLTMYATKLENSDSSSLLFTRSSTSEVMIIDRETTEHNSHVPNILSTLLFVSAFPEKSSFFVHTESWILEFLSIYDATSVQSDVKNDRDPAMSVVCLKYAICMIIISTILWAFHLWTSSIQHSDTGWGVRSF